MIGIELFSGVGGMSLGAEMAGIKMKLAVEIDKYAAETYLFNHKNVPIILDDIRNITTIPLKKYDSTILMGGPPCQGFSYSNQKTRNKENEKNWLFLEFVRIAHLWQPDWIVLENVSGLLKTENGFFLEKIISDFQKIGYTITYKILNAVEFGVPQKRQRLFLVGSKHGINFDFPNATTKQYITVKEAIEDLPTLTNGAHYPKLPYKDKAKSEYARYLRGNSIFSLNNNVTKNTNLILERYKYIPQGGNWENIPSHLMTNYKDYTRCHTGIYHRLIDNEPSTVIGNYRKNMLIHPWQDRGLSVREAARIQSFPDWFEFKGSIGFQQQQVGNAVPPILAKAIFQQILKY